METTKLNTNQWDEVPEFTVRAYRPKKRHEITNADLPKDAAKIEELFIERFPNHNLHEISLYIAAYFKKKEKAAWDKGYRKAFNEVQKDDDTK
jgi:hypothetical protein